MLKETTKQELAKRAGCSLAELNRALSTETEETLAFDEDGEFITHSDLDAIKERAGKESYKEGKRAGEEMFIKEIKLDESLDFEGKSKDSLLKALKEKIQKETGAEPNKLIEELKREKQTLQANLKEAEEKLENEKTQFTHKLTHLEIETLIKNTLPERLANGLTREQAYKLYKADREFAKTETGIALVDPTTKEVIKDKRLNPVSVAEDLKEFMSQFGEVNDGRGGSDTKPVKKSNIEMFTKNSEVQKYFEENNIPLSERAGVLAKVMKNEGFKINE